MNDAPASAAARLSIRIAQGAGLGAASLAAIVLWLWWQADGTRVGSPAVAVPAMKANTAIAFIFAGCALACVTSARDGIRRMGRVLATAAIAIGAATLVEYATGVDLGIDELIAADLSTATMPGRMALLAAANLTAIAVAISAAPLRQAGPSQWVAAAVAGSAYTTLIGYLYDTSRLYDFGSSATVAPQTAATLAVLAAGVFAARPNDGLVGLVTASTPGGRLARRFIPFSIVLPALLGWTRLAGERAGLYETSFGVALFAITVTLALIAVTLRSASWIDRHERTKADAAEALEQARQQANQRAIDLAAIVDASDDAIVSTSNDRVITSWNRGAERLYGYSAEEAIGQPIRLIIPRERLEESQDLGGKTRSGEGVVHLQTVRQTKTGELVDVSLTVSPIRSADGTVMGVSAIARDVTELRQASERFRLAFEAAPSGMMLVDRSGQIVLVNSEVERMFGYGRWELVGKPVDMLVPREQQRGHVELREGFLTSAQGRRMGVGRNVRGRRKDGSQFPAEVGLNPLITRDGLLILSVVVDVSERHAMLQRLEAQRAELQRSNDELMQFAYVASHDLQEPLRMVASYTELLSSRYTGQLDERADKYMNYIAEGATRMQRLIRDLLAYARVGTRAQAKTPVDLSKVARRVIGDLRPVIRESSADIVVHPLPTVMADETQMGQLLQNLIGNALKFRSERPPRVVVSAEQDGQAWRLTVEDNGIGIDPQFHDRVFEIFQRLHDRAAYDGSGVGLAVVKRIAERHGGRVWFESTPGQGSRFHVTLSSS